MSTVVFISVLGIPRARELRVSALVRTLGTDPRLMGHSVPTHPTAMLRKRKFSFKLEADISVSDLCCMSAPSSIYGVSFPIAWSRHDRGPSVENCYAIGPARI